MAYHSGPLGYLWSFTPNRGDGCTCGQCYLCSLDDRQRPVSPEGQIIKRLRELWMDLMGPEDLDFIPF